MAAVDLLFLVVVVLSAWSGWRSGFVCAAIGLITWGGSLAAAKSTGEQLIWPAEGAKNDFVLGQRFGGEEMFYLLCSTKYF
jgi:hypothetical protein